MCSSVGARKMLPIAISLAILVGSLIEVQPKGQRTPNDTNASNASDQQPSATGPDPVYFSRLPAADTFFGLPDEAHGSPEQPAARGQPVGSFYALDDPPGPLASPKVQTILLKALKVPKVEQQLQQPQVEQAERPLADRQPADFGQIDFGKIQQLLESQRKSADQQAAATPTTSRPHKLAAQLAYKPSLAARQKPVNLSALLAPGQVLLAQKSGNEGAKVASVSVREIDDLLRRLKPLAVSESEKPESERVPGESEAKEHEEANEDQEEGDDVDALDREDLEELRRSKRLERVLPTSHLFGGSVGVVGEDLAGGLRSPPKDRADERERRMFADSLAQLGAKLANGDSPTMLANVERDLPAADNPWGADSWRSSAKKRPRRDRDRDGDGRARADETPESHLQIPIEVLVDHLMSSSRLATFGLHHSRVGNPPRSASDEEDAADEGNSARDEDGDGERDEEEDDDDRDNNGTLSEESKLHASLEAAESSPVGEQSVGPPGQQLQSQASEFSSMLNRNNSWIPLDGIKQSSTGRSASQNTPEPKEGAKTGQSRKGKRKRKRSSDRVRPKKGELGLVIGNRLLNRRDLIMLIGILNRMASKRAPSKEREASRKLLRFLVKLVLDDFKKDSGRVEERRRNGEKDPNDTIKDLLRSILDGPASAEQLTNNSSIELKPLRVARKSSRTAREPARHSEESQPSTGEATDAGQAADKNRKTLRDLSEDLELYFDQDFFEDLADKSVPGAKAANESFSTLTTDRSRGGPGFRPARSKRVGYELPVPIYGKQKVTDEDDEGEDDDGEPIDHPRGRKRGSAVGRKPSEPKPGGVERRRRRRRQRPSVSANKRDPEREEEERELSTNERPDEPEERRETAEYPKRRRDEREDPDEEPDEVPVQIKKVIRKRKKRPEDEEEREDRQDDREYDRDQEEERESPKERAGSSRKATGRWKQQGHKHQAKIDPDSRYEIPAPIQKGKIVTPTKRPKGAATSKQAKGRTALAKRVAGAKGGPAKVGKGQRSLQANRPPGKRAPTSKKGTKQGQPSGQKGKRRDASVPAKGIKRKRIEPDEPASEEGKKGDPDDSDYYNEGTSYSQDCDDSGKCKVVIESSSPNLTKAIQARDKPTIAKHLGKWAESSSD